MRNFYFEKVKNVKSYRFEMSYITYCIILNNMFVCEKIAYS